jgi:predicted transposase YbfD/YdcC
VTLGVEFGGVVAVDGKSLRRAYERGRAFMPPLMVSVFDAETRLSLAARHAPGGDEIKATLEALKAVTLKGCTVTADALHCHPAMAEAVRARGGQYALRLKANHGPLFACVEKAFAAADASCGLSFHERSESGYGRREWRRASVIPIPPGAPAFPGLVAFGRIESERTSGGRTGAKVHYAALSKALAPRRFLETMRTHWERREPASLAPRRRFP